ncbi:PPC domain-containing protein [Parasphingopyxis marina]|uniref:PPC domain-containing protein n=1 Tax=Parasphingopyxis marina TaxID=2761622 RepID=A0A842I4B3_9SPHN|nr:PPC domain-containing protein [Parasphingopyxis marina]MBC2779034.1 PPC domain-containing protein [Parasphingopyxis marina]
MNTHLSRVAMATALALFAAPATMAQNMLTPGEPMTGELTNQSTRMYENDYYLDLYSVSGEAGQRIAIAMQAEDFDTLIEIGRMVDGEFQQIAVDDDGGEGLNSRLLFTFPETGTYIVRARTFGANATGSYSIEMSEVAPPAPPPPPGRIRLGQTVSGTLTDASPVYMDDSYGASTRHYALYNLRGRAGQTVTVTLRSDDFDAYLEAGAMTPLGFAAVESNDDGLAGEGEDPLGLDSRLTLTFVQSGTLTIRATTLGGGATGEYSLAVE